MEPGASLMRFGRDTPLLQAPALIVLAVAVVSFIAWLALTTREPNWLDVLRGIAAGVIGVVGIGYAGSWHDVVVDPAARQVTERHGFLRHPVTLPVEEQKDPLVLEAAARHFARLGGWPARRRHYGIAAAGTPGGAGRMLAITSTPYGTETPIKD